MKALTSKLAFALLVTVAAPSLAFAEEDGAKGTISSLEINHTSSDRYLQHHGRILVTSGKTSTEYRWGGVACGSRTLPENLVTMLQRALESGTPIVPRHQPGQGQSLCLVAFTLDP
jgi:hypothetical protein